MATTLWLAAALAVASLIYRYLLYPLFFSPLARIPSAHPLASITPAWILYKRYRHVENKTIYAAHEKHGPVVRLGPNELSVNCVENGLKTIYAGGFEKHSWYPNLFHNYEGVPNLFSTAESRPHAQRKRIVSNAYAKSTIQSSAGFAFSCQTIVHERLLPLLDSKIDGSGAGTLDIYKLTNYATMDLVTAYMFGLRSGTNFLQDNATADWWLDLYQSRKGYVFWPQELPRWTDFCARFGLHLSPQWVGEANSKLEEHCLELCDAAEKCLKESQGSGLAAQDVPMVFRQVWSALSVDKIELINGPRRPCPTRLAVASEMLDQLSAGEETSAITLTFLFYELCRHVQVQTELRNELHQLPALRRDWSKPPSAQPPLPPAKTLDALPLLHAVLLETLRLHPAIPGPQPRVTPYLSNGNKEARVARDGSGKAKAKATGSVTLGCHGNLPGGVRVSSSPYCLHRNAAVFAAPAAFEPRRWLDAGPAQLADMHRWFWPFSSGGRMCVGSNLAMQQMKLVAAVVVANFELCGTEEQELEQEDAYTAAPKGGRFGIVISRVAAAPARE